MKHIYGDGVPEDHELAVKLLTLYLETVKGSEYLTFDDSLLRLLGCFELQRRKVCG